VPGRGARACAEDATARTRSATPPQRRHQRLDRRGDPKGDRHIAWARDFFDAMQPHARDRVYVNFLGDEGADRVRQAYGTEKYDRLVELKSNFDPTNFFRLNQNIPPK
jgi:hypothetical protein